MTIYRQNSYKLLTIHKNEFRKTKNISKNDQNGSEMTQNQHFYENYQNIDFAFSQKGLCESFRFFFPAFAFSVL